MKIHFYIRYQSSFGEQLFLRLWNKKGTESFDVSLEYLNKQFWHLVMEDDDLPYLPTLKYECIRANDFGDTMKLFVGRVVDLRKHKGDTLDIIDEIPVPDHSEIFYTKPFRTLLERGSTTVKKPADKNFNVVLRAGIPPLPPGKAVCVTGAGEKLHDWDAERPLMMYKKDGFWTAKLNLGKERSIEYKYAIYDLEKKRIETFEEGENRMLHTSGKKGQTIVHQYPKISPLRWKGAGLNIHLSSLRSSSGWGTGTYTDLIELSDWAATAGFKMIQLLPVNDTITNGQNEDSYPYAAISAFALHPYHLDVRKLLIQTGVQLPDEMEAEASRLNALKKIDFQGVYQHRMKALRMIYEADGLSFKDDFAWFDFFDFNREWLVPYAVFCYLRDQHQTADHTQWGEHAIYDEESIHAMAEPGSSHYAGIAFYYYLQFHLHLQFKEAVYHIHTHDMVLKGDLPIGVGRHSVETWMYKHLFHLNQQSGAPPDAFSAGGQNWNFPTYHWEAMQQDEYRWWRKRLETMSAYFDAVRIDHVIGLFRIWSIPLGHRTGELGLFHPAKGFTAHELAAAGLHMNEERFCTPFINAAVLYFYFREDKARVTETYFEDNRFKAAFNSMASLEAWLREHPDPFEDALRDLMANVIFFKEGDVYHFRMNMQQTPSFQSLPEDQKHILNELYHQYFGERQYDVWLKSGTEKLQMMKQATTMMLCAEDLGMVPSMVPGVLEKMDVLSLYVERMPHRMEERFANPAHAPYISVVTPSTHDMEPIALWWQQHPGNAQYYYQHVLHQEGPVPAVCTPELVKLILQRQLQSPAMWVVFLLQDVLIADKDLHIDDPTHYRINDPGNDDHVWDYRVHITVEELSDQQALAGKLHKWIRKSGRA